MSVDDESSYKEKLAQQNEYHILNEAGEPVEITMLPDGLGDEVYLEQISDSESKLLPYKKLVLTDEGWGEEVEPGKVQQIQEKNIKVGKIDKANRTISFK